MKLSKQSIVIAILLSAALFFTGRYVWSNYYDLLLPVVGNVKYVSTSITGEYRNLNLFGLTLALIPVAAMLIWRFAPVISIHRRMLTVCIIMLSITVSVFARREIIRTKATNIQSATKPGNTGTSDPQLSNSQAGIPFESLKFEQFAFAGLIAGSLIAFYSLRQKKAG